MPKGAVKRGSTAVTTLKDIETGSVTIERSFTKNMSNFNSARVSVTMTLPIKFTESELGEAKKAAKVINETCERFLDAELDKLTI